MLKKTAHDFLEMECPNALVRAMEQDVMGYSTELNRRIADLGWYGLIFPEEYGGGGGSFLDLLVLLEEMGRALLPDPFFPTVVLGGIPILELGNDEQKNRLLTGICTGDIKATMALIEPDSYYNIDSLKTQATITHNNYVINGTKILVPYANIADFIICAVKTGEYFLNRDNISLLIANKANPGITCHMLPTIDRRKQYEVTLKNSCVPEENLLGEHGKGSIYLEKLLQKATVALCAEMIGSARQVLDMTVDYAKKRILFGRSMGSFQIIQEHFAEMLAMLEDSWLLTYEAGWMLNEGLSCVKEVSMAKITTNEAYQIITALGHRIHGGIGYDLEHDMSLFSRRVITDMGTFGNTDSHIEKVATEMGLQTEVFNDRT